MAKTSGKGVTTPVQERDAGKAIAVFSDGTGNSSAKQFKTNVWRMYEAVELGSNATAAEQIVYYDEGVGNSAVRPIAALGSVFGIGLKRNVLDLYRFLCRTYKRGDRIYAFGFSRGSFTIRMLVGLINKEGLIDYRGEADLGHQSADAFRSYLRGRNPFYPPMSFIIPLSRAVVRLFLYLKRTALGQRYYDRAANLRPEVRFVGVWDTVAAYGGPISEIVRGFDDWIRPLTFKDLSLPDIVTTARHALALDDERDAFQAVPWDEPYEMDRARLQQVWFAGMHADVGGGYPDDSLAFVSLAWMMKEASAAGLELREDKVRETNLTANAYGPMHDSRSGLGSYYRYQPRNLVGYIKPPKAGTQHMRDADLADGGINPVPWIDESVLCRIKSGTDGYAPITLPGLFRVVGASRPRNTLPQDVQQRVMRTAANREKQQERNRNYVWWRRVYYFATVFATLALVLLPIWGEDKRDLLCGDARCFPSTIIGWSDAVLPEFADAWIADYQRLPSSVIGLIIAILWFRNRGTANESKLRDRTRALWSATLAGRVDEAKGRSLVQWLRTRPLYTGSFKFLKTWVLPTVFGVAMLLAIVWLVMVAVAQIALGKAEADGSFCGSAAVPGGVMSTAAPCNPLAVTAQPGDIVRLSQLTVEEGARYRIDLYVREPWRNGSVPATPLGVDPRGFWERIGLPWRRVVSARYMEPLLEIRPEGEVDIFGWRRVHIMRLDLREVRPKRHYQATFDAPRAGSAAIFVNDAVSPFGDPHSYYRGDPARANQGTACVAVTHIGGDEDTALSTCPEGAGDPLPPAPSR